MKKFYSLCFAIIAMLLGNVSLAYAGSKTHYSKATATAEPTAAGKVYVSKTANQKGSSASATNSSDSKNDSDTHTYCFTAETNPGYTWVGWYDSKSGGAEKSKALQYNDDVAASSTNSGSPTPLNRYAIWNANTYYVAFDGNGSTGGSMSNQTFSYGTAQSLTANAFTRVGYSFAGWAKTADGAVTYANEASVNNLTTTANATVDLFAQWTLNTYSVAFHGNGNTAGEMASQSFNYGEEKALTANAFVKSYTLTFDANGGECATANIVSTYDFGGWATSADGDKLYDDAQSVSNLSLENNAVVNLYAKWNNGSVQLPAATNTGFNLEGWFISGTDTKIGDAGSAYTPTADLELEAHWTSSQLTPSFGGADTELNVGDLQTSAFLLNNTDGPVAHIEVVSVDPINDGSGVVIEYNAATNTITARNAGVATIYFTQEETTAVVAGTSSTWTYTVTKKTPSFTGSNYPGMKVGEIQITDFVYTSTSSLMPSASTDDDFYFTVDEVVFTNEAKNNGAELLNFDGSAITALNAGSGKITLHQKETYMYNAASQAFEVGIAKHTPDFIWNAAGTLYHNTTVANVFSSSNADLEYTVTSSDPTIANVKDNTLHLLTKAGTATITFSQEENYKWNAKEQSYNVTPVFQTNHVPFTYSQAMYNAGDITTQKVSTYGTAWDGDNGVRLGGSSTAITSGNPSWDWDDKYIIICISGIPDKLSFQHKTNSGSATQAAWYVQESANGSSWTEVWTSDSKSDSWQTVSNKQLKSGTRYLKFCWSGNFAGYFKDVKITELKQFAPTATSLDFGTNYIKEACAAKTFDFKYANAGHKLTLSVNDDHFTVSPTEITSIGGEKTGTYTPITVTYNTDEEHTANGAKITITDELGNSATVNLSAKTIKYSPEIAWADDFTSMTYLDIRDGAAVVTPNTLPLLYSSTNTDVIKVTESDTRLEAVAAGEATITAYTEETELYYAGQIQKVVTVEQAEPSITTWPAAAGITYGQTLAEALLSGEEAQEGAFAWKDATIAPEAGTPAYTVVFTPANANYKTVENTVTVEVAKAASELTDPEAVTELVYDGNAHELITAGSSAHGELLYSLDDENYAAALPAATAADTYTVYYKLVGDANHEDVAAASLEVTIAKASLTVTAEDTSIVYGAETPAFSFTTEGWIGTDDESLLTGEVAYACEYEAGKPVDSYAITPSNLEAANYTITFVAGTLTVTKAAAELTAPEAVAELVYNGDAQELITAGTSADGEILYSLDDENYAAALPAAVNADTYTVYYKLVGDANHEDVAAASLEVTIAKAALTVTAEDKSITYGAEAPAFTFTTEGWQGADEESLLTGEVAYACEYEAGKPVDSYAITPSNLEAANYTITFVAGTLSVTKAAAELTVPEGVGGIVYDGDAHELITAGTSADGELLYSLDNENYAAALPTAVNADTYTVYYKLVGDANHEDVAAASLEVTIAKAASELTAPEGVAGIVYDGDAHELITAGTSVHGELLYSLDDENYAAALPTAVDADTYTVYYKLVGDANHEDVAAALLEVTIAKAAAELTAPEAVAELVYNGDAQELITAGTSSDGELLYSLDDENYAAALPTAVAADTYTVYYKLVGDANHEDVAAASLEVTIAKAALTITADDKSVAYGAETPAFTFTAAGWQGADDESLLTGEVAYACEYEAGKPVGSYAITPSNLEAANYTITFVAGTLTVTKATAEFTAPEGVAGIVYDGDAHELITAGTSADGELLYSLDNENYAAALPTAVAADTYTVYYKLVGDANHEDVAAASLEVTIAKAVPVITTDPTASELTVNQSLETSELIGGEADVEGAFAWEDATVTPTEAGVFSYNVIFTPADALNYETVVLLVEVTVNAGSGTGLDDVQALGALKAVYTITGQLVTTEPETIDLGRGAYIFLYENGSTKVFIP